MPAYLLAWATTVLGLVPLAWVAWRRWHSTAVDPAFWWLAVALGVSCVADVLARVLPPWMGFSYVIAQSAIVAAVFLLRRSDSIRYAVALALVGCLAVFVRAPDGRDYLLHIAAWASVACIVQEQSVGRLRDALVFYFGAGLVAYIFLAAFPGWPSWIIYQLTRVVGIVWFCAACVAPVPRLRVLRPVRAS